MTDQFLDELDPITTIADTSLLHVETDPTGTAEDNKITWANFKTTLGTALGAIVDALSGKSTPADADFFLLGDSAASNASKEILWSEVRSLLKNGTWGSRGLAGNNNAGTPNTQYDFSADVVVLRNSTTNEIFIKTATGTVTCNVSTAGPAANGRDQAGAFSASTWIHFHWIYNPSTSTLATLSSTSYLTPFLPSGYTYGAYIGAVYFDASSHLMSTRIRGCNVFYNAEQVIVSAGSATTETNGSTTAIVPPNALTVFGKVTATYQHTAANATISLDIRVLTGVNFLDINITTQVANIQMRTDTAFLAPNVGQNFIYLWSSATGTKALYLICSGYTVPNGST